MGPAELAQATGLRQQPVEDHSVQGSTAHPQSQAGISDGEENEGLVGCRFFGHAPHSDHKRGRSIAQQARRFGQDLVGGRKIAIRIAPSDARKCLSQLRFFNQQ
jgi:hypothetical protein